ncbi:MAG TPA: hypothetical protein VII43_04165 [Opitutaceae bacterium]
MQPSAEDKPRWWIWPTILSLDAPAVAVLWQLLLADAASVSLGAPETLVLGSSVWLAYSSDRWFEGWRVEPGRIRTHRHRFTQRLRWPLAFAWAAVLGLDLSLSLLGLSHRELKAGFLLLGPVVAYLLFHQLLHRGSRWRPPKELCVAVLLAGGAAVFIAARPGAHLRAMAIPLAIFALLCLSNCALISVWEDEVDRSHGQTSLALQFARGAAFSRILPWLLSALCAAAWICAGEGSRAAAACGAASGVLLGLVDLAERRIGRSLARVLADVALATPAIPLILRALR